jgi:hypothetical protein
MEERKIVLGDVFFVFTNFGLVKGRVMEIKEYLINNSDVIWESEGAEGLGDNEDFSITQYKLNLVDFGNDGTEGVNHNVKWGFWYSEHQLYDDLADALLSIEDTWGKPEV